MANRMRIAFVHDYIKEYGGAERVLEALHEIWPEAPVYTTVYLPEFLGPHRERFKDWKIETSWLQYIPFKEKLISPFRIIAPFVFKMFDMSSFDVVIISATGAYIPNTVKIPNSKFQIPNKSSTSAKASADKQNTKYKIQNTVHVCYCHTPPRYLYGYATARNWNKSIILGSIGKMFNHILRLIDFKAAQNVDYFIANSMNVASRITKFYRRDSTVIYPPVNSSLYQVVSSKYKKYTKYILHNTGYYLAGGRIARPKNIDLIVKTFVKLGLPLKVFGREFAGHDSLFMIHNSNIEFLGEVSDEEKLELMRNAKAYIFASEDEDFGITPVEAASVGTPVIAYRSGGVVESIVDKKTGLFFDELTVESLTKAIKQFSNLTIDSSECIKQAKKFSKERFKREIKELVEKKAQKRKIYS